MPLADATFAGYTIVRMLGSGGMGEVYLAQHPRLPRHDALKVLPTSVSADSEYPIEEESPVRVCMQQTGRTRLAWREMIRRSNLGLP
jgi:serine/threonine protein kinase